MRKGLWALFLDCAFRMLIGWADKLQSHGNLKGFLALVNFGFMYFEKRGVGVEGVGVGYGGGGLLT